MRSYIFLVCTSFLLACSGDDTVGSRPQSGTGNGSGGASTSGGGSIASGSNTSGGAGSTSSTGGNASTSSGAVGSTTGSGGAAGATASGGAGGAAGRAGSGGVVVDASVETGPPPPPPDPGPLSGGGAGCIDVDPVHQGTATFFDITPAGAPGHCSYDLSMQPEPPYWIAMNQARYAASAACGACVQISGTGTIIAQVVDECPANSLHCDSMEHIDINRPGFGLIGDPNAGVVPITWKYVPCDVQTSNVELFTQGGSNTFFATIGVRKHRYRVAKVELVTGATRVALVRRADNFFIIDTTTPAGAAGMALGPFRIRITDIYNHWIENKVALTVGQNVSMGLQFLTCPAGGDAGP